MFWLGVEIVDLLELVFCLLVWLLFLPFLPFQVFSVLPLLLRVSLAGSRVSPGVAVAGVRGISASPPLRGILAQPPRAVVWPPFSLFSISFPLFLIFSLSAGSRRAFAWASAASTASLTSWTRPTRTTSPLQPLHQNCPKHHELLPRLFDPLQDPGRVFQNFSEK